MQKAYDVAILDAPEPIQRLFDFDPSALGGPVPAPVEDLSAVAVLA